MSPDDLSHVLLLLLAPASFVVGALAGLSHRRRGPRVPAVGEGPYRTPAERTEAPTGADALSDMRCAIEDAVAKLNQDLRNGDIDAQDYGHQLVRLAEAAGKAASLQKAMHPMSGVER